MLKKMEMSKEVYRLRRKVIDLIREAKELVPTMPRITVRITDNHVTTLARATMKRNYIEVSERAINSSSFDLRTIVFHELVHAIWGIKHDENCPLMKPIYKPLSKNDAKRLFLMYAKKQEE
jgi:valyl-tRNA synthetase